MKLIKRVIFIFILIVAIYYLDRYVSRQISYPTKYSEIVISEATKNNLDPYLIFAVIKKESNFNSDSKSNKEAKGLMQILDSTAKDVTGNDDYNIYDPETNIAIGTKYLSSLILRYDGDVPLALAAYNGGLGNVDKWKDDPVIYKDGQLVVSNIPFEETKNYVQKTLFYYSEYTRIYVGK